MKLNGFNLVDPKSVLATFDRDGLATDHLVRCNSQTFKAIDGYGTGHFLLTSDQSIPLSVDDVTLSITDSLTGIVSTHKLFILNKQTLHHPDQTELYVYLLTTAEEKYELTRTDVVRNYNLIKRSDIVDGSAVPFWSPDDATQPTLAGIITAILPGGYTLVYTAPTITPWEVNIQGMTTFDAIETLCRAFLLFWTVKDRVITVFTNNNDQPSFSSINDIRKTRLSNRLKDLSLIHPVVANGTQRNSRYTNNSTSSGQGLALNSYMPFLPAVYTNGEILQNTTQLTGLMTILSPLAANIALLEDFYLVYEQYKLVPLTTSFAVVIGDLGEGPRTILTAKDYPFLKIPQPYTFDPTLSGSVGSSDLYNFTLTGDLAKTVGATASASATAANTIGGATTAITVVSPGRFRAFTGAIGTAIKIATNAYWIIEVDQPAERVLATLDAHPNSNPSPGSGTGIRYGADPREANAALKTSPAPVALTNYPYGFLPTIGTSVPNPYDLFGEDGDKAVLAWDPVSELYFLEEVFPQRQQELWAILASDRGTGLAASLSCTPITPNSDGAWTSSPVTAYDKYNVAINGKAGDRILLKWDARNSHLVTGLPVAGYVAIVCEHTATRVKGTLNGSFSATPATFSVSVVAGMDGVAPASPITVSNRYGWPNGDTGASVEVWYDSATGSWYATQMAWTCPP